VTDELSTSRARAALGGLLAAAAALGVGELVAGIEDGFASPVEAVASAIIDRAPRPVERFAIETFGSNDKLALVIGTVLLSAVFGVLLGLVARARPRAAALGFVAFAAVGVASSLSARGAGSGLAAAVPSVAAGLAGVAALRLLVRSPAPAPAPAAAAADVTDAVVPVTRGGMASRRAFLGTSALVATAAAAAATGGRALRARFSAAESRAAVRLPRPTRPLPPITRANEVGVEGVTPFVTPNKDFYRVDTALIVPQVRAEDWTLRVTGMVDDPLELTFEQLLARDIVEADVTLTCVSNQVGGDLVGNARWLGVLARDLLEEAGVRRGADQLVGRSTDGYTCGFPLDHAYDRNCLVAVGMNGEPLPLRHGFPARLVTPGVYGYVGSTKWLTELEVTTFAAFDQYWVPRGYAEKAPIKTMARIDTPRSLARVSPGTVTVAGVAWAQARGIEAVEVRIDDGEFRPAELADAPGKDTWRQWRFDWDATPGRHDITVRATDGTGELQTEERSDVLPDGASGWMSLAVTVEDAA
jgi:DMSO/TMAO reductase YedYZ molybdopterin-dependent catalytic subunit